jgi:hypothetical protein
VLTSHSDSSSLSFPKALPPDYDGHNLVFVVGCGRSGTTWLQRLLASHPKVRTGQESNVFGVNVGHELAAFRTPAAPRYTQGTGLACYFTEEEFLRILRPYMLALLRPMVGPLGPGELFLEKTPEHALFLREISELLPRARVIHMLRDPRDVVSSMLAGDQWLSSWAPKSASAAAGMWLEYVRAVRNTFSKLPPNQFHEVRYESLSRSPEEVLRGCVDFLGLEWSAAEIAKAVDANLASKARRSGGGTPIPLFGEAAKRSGSIVVEPKGFIRKAQPGAWRKDLSLYEKFRVWRVAHELMEEVGYQWPKAMVFTFAFASALADVAKRGLSSARKTRRRWKR